MWVHRSVRVIALPLYRNGEPLPRAQRPTGQQNLCQEVNDLILNVNSLKEEYAACLVR
jgi:hypothetical protein